MKPLCIDLYAGLGGWTEGFLAEGYEVVGFDIEHHVYGDQRYPGHLCIQDVTTLHGSQFKYAAVIVASPPCQEFSYMAMPWTRAKQIAKGLRGQGDFPDGYKGSRTVPELRALFDACFRIQREAIAAAGHHIPLVVENVKGAQPWVGKAQWHYGSYYLWGDVPALMPMTLKAPKMPGRGMSLGDVPWGPHHTGPNEKATKNAGGSWFSIGSPGQKVVNQNPVTERRALAAASKGEGKKGVGIGSASWQDKANRHPDDPRNTWSGSKARKAASARIAKIPFPLSRWIAHVYKPEQEAVA